MGREREQEIQGEVEARGMGREKEKERGLGRMGEGWELEWRVCFCSQSSAWILSRWPYPGNSVNLHFKEQIINNK